MRTVGAEPGVRTVVATSAPMIRWSVLSNPLAAA
jgi:hypothetical protein